MVLAHSGADSLRELHMKPTGGVCGLVGHMDPMRPPLRAIRHQAGSTCHTHTVFLRANQFSNPEEGRDGQSPGCPRGAKLLGLKPEEGFEGGRVVRDNDFGKAF
jgi:hypothetical protein